MRKVASYLMMCGVSGADSGDNILSEIDGLVSSWIQSKSNETQCSADIPETLNLADGSRAEIQNRRYGVDDRVLREVTLKQEVEGGSFETRIAYAPIGDNFYAYCELRASGEAYQVAPLRLDVRCPEIVRSILDSGHDWYVGDVLLVSSPVPFMGSTGGTKLRQILWHSDRNLPFVVVSEHEGKQLSEQFSNRLAADLSGLAIVATIDQDAAWELTLSEGKQWSCFNGAVRLYWPNLTDPETKPWHHPLWTRYTLQGVDDDLTGAADRLRKQLRRQILGLSAFSVLEPEVLRQIRTDASRAEIEAARDQLRQNEDWEELAQDYAKENDDLRREVDHQKSEIDDLRDQLNNLQTALRWQSEQTEEVPPRSDAPPATVSEAVEYAQKEFADELLFGEAISEGILGLAKDAGPPEKILKYLEGLAEMARAQRQGPLGMSIIAWLNRKGLIASGESETILNNKDEMRKRTWKVAEHEREFKLHLKPAEATSPDRCVRIYFEQEAESGKVAVGWIGRHP